MPKRTSISLETKIKVLEYLKSGHGPTYVGRVFGFGEGTIRTIRKNEEAIRQSIIAGSKLSSKTQSYSRNPFIEKTEKLLVFWIEDMLKKRIPIEISLIKEKAFRLCYRLQELEPTTSIQATKKIKFNASDSWMQGFLKRNYFQNIKIKGQIATADVNCAKMFSEKLQSIIDTDGYSPDQVFNVGEMQLYWKKILLKSAKEANDRTTFLFCSNASGDKMLKPLFINNLIGIGERNLAEIAVHLVENKKSFMKADLFTYWFNNCFVPEVQEYLEQKGLEFKVILLVENCPNHPTINHPNVQFLYFPSNTASLIQPLDQGFKVAFKMLYIKQAFKYILNSKIERNFTSFEAWSEFTIENCITSASLALGELHQSILNVCWKNILPTYVENQSFLSQKSQFYFEIKSLSNAIGGEGFDNMQTVDIDELLRDCPLSDEDLIEFMTDYNKIDNKVQINEQVKEEVKVEPPPFSTELIKEGLDLAEKLGQHFVTHDPDKERALSFQYYLSVCMAGYKDFYKQSKRQDKLCSTEFTPSEDDGYSNISSPMELKPLDIIDVNDSFGAGGLANEHLTSTHHTFPTIKQEKMEYPSTSTQYMDNFYENPNSPVEVKPLIIFDSNSFVEVSGLAHHQHS